MTRLVAATLLLAFVPIAMPSASAPVVRVLTYNIHHGEGTDGQFDLLRLARIIAAQSPDVVALQEVDQATNRSGGVRQLDELARLTHLHGVFGKAMEFDGGEYGDGILTRWPIRHTTLRPLPGSIDREPRVALTVDLKGHRGLPVLRFTCTHFAQGRYPEDRVAQASALVDTIDDHDTTPHILAGDFNTLGGTDVMQIVGRRWQDAFPEDAWAAGAPRDRRPGVDHVLARPRAHWRTVEARVVDAPVASDHRPVLAVLEWAAE